MDKSITIHGPGPDHLTVDGNHASGVFRVQVGGGGTATIAGLTITNGNANRGGGINNESSMLTVSNCTISGNSAPDVFGAGGGIFNDVAFSNATLEILNCTISGNSAGDNGGGIYNGGNYSDPILKIGDTILNAGPSGENIHNESGTTISLGYNLSSDNGGGYLTATSDRINTHPRLGPLQNNGGPTFPQLPASNSPAIDAGDPTLGGDQRGSDFVRVMNCRIDIGAVEVQATPTPTPMPTPHGHGRH